MLLSSAEIAALELGPYNLGLFVRLGITPPLQCWLGVGPIAIGVNTLDPSGAIYNGFGQVLGLPVFEQMINGAASRVELQLSSLDNRTLALASFANVVRGKRCDIGLGLLGNDWQLLGPVHWVRHNVADFLSMSVTPAGDPKSGQTTKTAALSIGSSMTGRRRRGLSYFSNQDQQAKSPTDRFCERAPLYSQLGQKTWPKFA